MIFIFIIWSLIILKAVFFWAYLWQIKEYRLDRFKAEYGSIKKIIRFWITSGGRRLYFPKLTIKAIILILLSFSIIVYGTLAVSVFSINNNTLILFILIFLYLITAPVACLAAMVLKIPTFFVKSLIIYLAKKKMARFSNIIVIGIAGSYGKSSTKELVFQILKDKFNVKKTPANVNTEIGVAKSALFDLNGTENIFVAEMGAYKIGEIKKICDIVKPKIGILTGLGPQHIELFGSFQNTQKAKYELIQALPVKDGLALFNGENHHCMELSWNESWGGKKIIYKKITSLNLLRFASRWPEYQLENAQAAVEVAKYLGMSDLEIEKAFSKIKPEEKIMKSFLGKREAVIINDSYNANPDGVFANLDYLASQPYLEKIIVMPCLIELGKFARDIHYEIGVKIAKTATSAIITSGEHFSSIKRGAGNKVVLETDPQRIIELLTPHLNKKTIILLEGRVPELVIKFLKQ